MARMPYGMQTLVIFPGHPCGLPIAGENPIGSNVIPDRSFARTSRTGLPHAWQEGNMAVEEIDHGCICAPAHRHPI